VSYLSLVVARMNMDDQSDYAEENKPLKPTLSYSQKAIFPAFCRLVSLVERIE
jgi:hypothetical protein